MTRQVAWPCVLFLGFAAGALAQQTVVSGSRSIDWSGAGVSGGIPTRINGLHNAQPGCHSGRSINSAIAACASGQVVQLSPGTYNLLSGITFNNKSGVTLRGAGPNQTFLVFCGSGNSCAEAWIRTYVS